MKIYMELDLPDGTPVESGLLKADHIVEMIDDGRATFRQISSPLGSNCLTHGELRDLGIMQEINRVLLHPRGLAMGSHYPDDAVDVTQPAPITVFRDTDEAGRWYNWANSPGGPEAVMERARAFSKLLDDRDIARGDKLGFGVQPLPGGDT